jgi:hypothetical protein
MKYNPTLVRLLLTSIDDVEMRRLKEAFYGIMKLANAVKDKGADAKAEMREFVRDNKMDKPQVEAIIRLGGRGGGTATAATGRISVKEEVSEVMASFGVAEHGEARKVTAKKKKGKKLELGGFKKKLQLNLGGGVGDGDSEDEEKKILHSEKVIEGAKNSSPIQGIMNSATNAHEEQFIE